MSHKRYKEWNLDCKVYVGNLSEATSKSEVENAFGRFGQLKNVWLARNPPGFAFVEFEDSRDAEDSCRALDGTRIGESRVRVEMSHGRTRRGGYQSSVRRGGDRYGRDGPRENGSRYERSYRPSRSRSRSRSRSFSRSRSRSRGSAQRRNYRYVPSSRSPRRSPSHERVYMSPNRSPRSPRGHSPRRTRGSPRGRSRSPIKDRR